MLVLPSIARPDEVERRTEYDARIPADLFGKMADYQIVGSH
jgi:hypothetical protein